MKIDPNDFAQRIVTAKITESAWARAHELKEKHGVALFEVLSICLMHMREEDFTAALAIRKEAIEALPKSIRAVLREYPSMTAEQRQQMRDLFSK